MTLPIIATVLSLALAPSLPPATDFDRAEVKRIQTHFDGALQMLAARDVSALTEAQRANRAALVSELRRYRDRGAFPRNYDFPGEAVPYFIDRKTAIRCAVAHLMEHTGAQALVARVADLDNNVWVAELAGDAEVAAWLEANGLTLEEAARIQVPYIGDAPQGREVPTLRSAGPPSGQVAMAMGSALATTALNHFVLKAKPSRGVAVAGFLTGAFAAGTGASAYQAHDDNGVAIATIAAGGIAMFVAGRSYHRFRQQRIAASTTTIAPIIPVDGTQGVGAALTFRF